MAKVFLDANYFIRLANRAPEVDTEILDKHEGYIATLSCHILFYINKIDVPDSETNSFIRLANRAPEVDTEILDKHEGYIATLSCHILFYINKIDVPDSETNSFIYD